MNDFFCSILFLRKYFPLARGVYTLNISYSFAWRNTWSKHRFQICCLHFAQVTLVQLGSIVLLIACSITIVNHDLLAFFCLFEFIDNTVIALCLCFIVWQHCRHFGSRINVPFRFLINFIYRLKCLKCLSFKILNFLSPDAFAESCSDGHWMVDYLCIWRSGLFQPRTYDCSDITKCENLPILSLVLW